MGSITKFRKKDRGRNIEAKYCTSYYYDNEELSLDDSSLLRGRSSFYEAAECLKWERMFGVHSGLSPEEQLKNIQREITIRVRITQNEIFIIGELLIHAKNICQQGGKKFQEWISKKVDFSYETANNFMNVYKNCLGIKNIAMKLSPSILYQISAPGFPEELKKYLFDTEQLDKITNGRLKEITRKYKEGGLEAIKDSIEELTRGHIIFRQSMYTIDMLENALRTLDDLRDKILRQGHLSALAGELGYCHKHNEPEAYEINSKLINALNSATELLDKTLDESKEILVNVKNKLHAEYGIGVSSKMNKNNGKTKINKLTKKVADG